MYNIGDRVFGTDLIDNNRAKRKYGYVREIDNSGNVFLVEFDDDIAGHGGGCYKPRHCWWCNAEQIALVTVPALKFKKGDNVIIKSTEYRQSYACVLECVGTIVDAEYQQHIDDERITYRVRVNNLDNKYQVDGLWIFHEEKSLELCTATNMNKLCGALEHPIYMPYRMSIIDDVCLSTDAFQLSSDYINDLINSMEFCNKPSSDVKTTDIKGDKNNMNKILEIYRDKKYAKISDKNIKDLEKVKLADENYKVYKECVDKLAPIYEKTKQSFHDITEPYMTEATNKKIDELEHKRFDDEKKLSDEIHEIEAQLSMCETYEQKEVILKRYNVIDVNGKINA